VTDLLFAIFDVKMRLFMSPYCGRNVDSALRQFSDMCNNPNNQLARHPEDFELYEVGTFDDATGIIVVIEPRLVARAKDLKDPS